MIYYLRNACEDETIVDCMIVGLLTSRESSEFYIIVVDTYARANCVFAS